MLQSRTVMWWFMSCWKLHLSSEPSPFDPSVWVRSRPHCFHSNADFRPRCGRRGIARWSPRVKWDECSCCQIDLKSVHTVGVSLSPPTLYLCPWTKHRVIYLSLSGFTSACLNSKQQPANKLQPFLRLPPPLCDTFIFLHTLIYFRFCWRDQKMVSIRDNSLGVLTLSYTHTQAPY